MPCSPWAPRQHRTVRGAVPRAVPPIPRAEGTRGWGLPPEPRRELSTLPLRRQRARCPDGSGLQVRGRRGCLLAGVPPEPSGPLRGGCSPPEGAERGRAREVWGSLRGLPTFPARQRQAAPRPGPGGAQPPFDVLLSGTGGGVCRKIAHNRARASAPSHQWGGGPLPERCLGAARPGGGSGGGRADPVRSRVSQSRKFAPAAAVPEGPGPERGAGGGGAPGESCVYTGKEGELECLYQEPGLLSLQADS